MARARTGNVAAASVHRAAPWAPPVLIAGGVLLAAGLAGLGTDTESAWFGGLDRPAFYPPDWAFGVAWTILYPAIAVAAILTWRAVAPPARPRLAMLLAANGLLNAAWTWLFFTLQAPVAAGIEITVLLVTIVALAAWAWRRSWPAVGVFAAYGAWVAFAGALTWGFAALN